ncbi:MAG TPA: MFS transporter [Candidatus Ruania gallistercoris]|uniref:MFS transporter n=1 Tax=Candidatus Ruania gallistercoris TaxID=2838746 RepID=A0A9D2EDV7_9MICO|nr:MFS transporter [Candidatus Ruania gallistercoris]
MPIVLYILALAVFAQGTSEFVLAGLLPGIAGDLDISLAQAGLLTSAFAVGMALGAPVMAAVGRGLSPRWTMSGFLALFILAHVIGATAESFGLLFATRVVAALANAGFLAVALSTVTHLVPAHSRARALAVILGGTTLALIAGVPAGALVGNALGWRATLWAIALVSVPALIAVLTATPTRAARTDQAVAGRSLTGELRTLRLRPVQVNSVMAVLVNAATFCSFTYLAVIAGTRAGVSEALVPLLLGVFGLGAFLGVTAAGRLADRSWRQVILVTGPLLVLGWVLLTLMVGNQPVVWVLALLLGALSFALGSTLIGRIMATAGEAPSMSGSFATVAMNLGAVLGPIAGGVAIELVGVRGPLAVSALLALAAVALGWAAGRVGADRPRTTVPVA